MIDLLLEGHLARSSTADTLPDHISGLVTWAWDDLEQMLADLQGDREQLVALLVDALEPEVPGVDPEAIAQAAREHIDFWAEEIATALTEAIELKWG